MTEESPSPESTCDIEATVLPWRRNLHRYENTVELLSLLPYQFGASYGLYLDQHFRNKAGESLSHLPEVKGAAILWFAANGLLRSIEKLIEQTEYACNVIAVLDGCKRHDERIDDATLQVIVGITRGSREGQALAHSTGRIDHVLGEMTRVLSTFDGVLKGVDKVNVQDRLERIIAETQVLKFEIASAHSTWSTLPRTPYALRQRAMTELLACFNVLMDELTSLRVRTKHLPLPGDLAHRLHAQTDELRSIKHRLQKWRDNPSQRFRGRFKDAAEKINSIAHDLCMLKDVSFHHAKALGMRFFDRTGYID